MKVGIEELTLRLEELERKVFGMTRGRVDTTGETSLDRFVKDHILFYPNDPNVPATRLYLIQQEYIKYCIRNNQYMVSHVKLRKGIERAIPGVGMDRQSTGWWVKGVVLLPYYGEKEED